jgi:hypothetical protein
MEKQYVELVLFYLGMMLMAGSALIWAIFIRDFVRKHGGKPAFVLFNWSPIFDYRRARQITKKTGRVPWFLRLFEAMLAAAFLIVIVLMVRLVIEFG